MGITGRQYEQLCANSNKIARMFDKILIDNLNGIIDSTPSTTFYQGTSFAGSMGSQEIDFSFLEQLEEIMSQQRDTLKVAANHFLKQWYEGTYLAGKYRHLFNRI